MSRRRSLIAGSALVLIMAIAFAAPAILEQRELAVGHAEPVFNNLITQEPITGFAESSEGPLVAARGGIIYDLEGNVVFDVSDDVIFLSEGDTQSGLQDMIEHPDGGVLVTHTYHDAKMRLVHVTHEGRQTVFEWQRFTQGGHAGGALAWNSNGQLLLSTGDGIICTDYGLASARPDECLSPQQTDNVLGKVIEYPSMRIIAMGLRHPWSMTRGPENQLYIFDAGDKEWEMIKMAQTVLSEQNFGWPLMEGPDCLDGYDCSDFIQPAHYHAHGEYEPPHCALIGGPYFKGKVLWGDYCAGSVWALDPYTHENTRVAGQVAPLLTNLFVHDNRLYASAKKQEGYGLYEVGY